MVCKLRLLQHNYNTVLHVMCIYVLIYSVCIIQYVECVYVVSTIKLFFVQLVYIYIYEL